MSVDLVDYRIAMFQSHSEVVCSLTLGEVPGDLDLYVYLNIEMDIVLLQWVFFAAMPSLTLNPLGVVTVGSMSGVFCYSAAGVCLGCQVPCCSSLGCTQLYTALYYLHIQIIVNFVFSYDLVLVFIAKAFLLSSVIFKSYSTLSNSRQN